MVVSLGVWVGADDEWTEGDSAPCSRFVPQKGTPPTRSAADDLTHDMVVTACREFARAVRRIDKTRPITTGHSMPRPVAYHLQTQGDWIQDTREEFAENLLAVTPDPCNRVSASQPRMSSIPASGGK